MDALVVNKPKDVIVGSWQDPEPGPNDIVVQVASCGVCGTDRHVVDGTYPAAYPNVLGHEFAGTIISIGANVERLNAGDEVAIDPNIPDYACAACRRGDIHLCERLQAIGITRPGGMAPYAVVPQSQAHQLPSGLSLEHAAFAEPLSCIIHGLERVRLNMGGSVVILGAGSIGLLMQQAVRSIGASIVVVSEPSPARRALAEDLGADEVYTPEMIEHESHSEGYDLVIDCTGSSDALAQTVRLARRGADILSFGVAPAGRKVALEPYELYRKELRIVSSNINPFTMEKALAMLGAGTIKVDGILSDRVGLKDLPSLLLAKPAASEVKVAVRFS